MVPEILKMLIKSACSDGTISDTDRQLLEKKASGMGVSLDELNQLINNELTPQIESESSGFVTEEETSESLSSGFVTGDEEASLSSGFVTETDIAPTPPPQQPLPQKEKTFEDKLTDIQLLSKQGAMSIVSKAKLYGKWIIVKRIKPEFKDNPQYRNLFLKEFENCYNLDHENIVKILDKGEDSDGLYYTMEYVDGRSLSDCIKNGELKSEKLIKSVVKQLCSALSYVHKKQIVHRDLKPDNIMITYRGDNVKILDFGIAYTDSYDDNLVKVGTPKYAAPEQNGKGNLVDQRADIYAVGLILLEMATGSLQDREAKTVANPNFKLVITKATKQDPQDRYHDCEELMEDLNKNIVIPVTPPETPAPPEPPVKKPEPVVKQEPKITPVTEGKKKKSILPWILIAAVLVGVGVFFFLKSKKTVEPKQNEVTENTENNGNQQQQNEPDNHNSVIVVDPSKKEEPKKEDYTEKEKEEGSEENSIIKDLAKRADDLFDEKNMAGAKVLYDSIQKLNPNYKNDNIQKCNDIIKNAKHPLTKKTGDNGKLGFADSDGNLVIDCLYDNADYSQGFMKDKLYALKKNGKWGVIDMETKKELTEFKFAAAKGIPGGFDMRFKGIGQHDPQDVVIKR
ncbi:MAG: protein kinase [Bacteroidales bacterium]|nr:protein kinase [Bacteroidales bacterium]